MKRGFKHLIECHCFLPQYRNCAEPVYHRFIVFSEIDDDDNVVHKRAQCNNCGVIHRIIDIGKSEIDSGRDTSAALVSISDVKLSLPANISSLLESYNADIARWEEAAWIIDNHMWGSHITLTAEEKGQSIEGKCLKFVGPDSVKIEPYSIQVAFPSR